MNGNNALCQDSFRHLSKLIRKLRDISLEFAGSFDLRKLVIYSYTEDINQPSMIFYYDAKTNLSLKAGRDGGSIIWTFVINTEKQKEERRDWVG